MKTYPVTDLTGDRYLNPVGAQYGDGSGTHQRAVGQITSISIHHDAVVRPHDYDSVARYRAEAAVHYNRLGPGLQYHYKIDNVGEIFRIRPHTTWLYVVGSAENVTNIAICLDGNFENQEPTREQFEALYQLLEELCERHPEFPATWPDVRPHADFSATACCGAKLRNSIYPIQDKASAQANLLNKGTYDWPELQPSAPAPAPTPTPTPEPVPTPAPPTVIINYRVKMNNVQIGAYSVDKNAWQKHVGNPGSLIFDQNGNDVTAQLEAKFAPPVPPTPATPDQSHDYSEQLGRIEAILNWIKELLSKIFK